MSLENKKIIFFDGFCILCSSFIDRVYKADKQEKFNFAPLQGQSAQILLNPTDQNLTKNLDTLAYLKNGKILIKSDAVLEISKDLGGIHQILYVTKIIPKFIRDTVYDFISGHRYKIIGKKESCRLPNKDRRILD